MFGRLKLAGVFYSEKLFHPSQIFASKIARGATSCDTKWSPLNFAPTLVRNVRQGLKCLQDSNCGLSV
jgi:hypothetical protein